jgi:hypothetical protein
VVIEIRGDKVRLGIQCEKDIPVHRTEVQAEIQKVRDETAFADFVADDMYPAGYSREALKWACLCGIRDAEDEVTAYADWQEREAYRCGREWREKKEVAASNIEIVRERN